MNMGSRWGFVLRAHEHHPKNSPPTLGHAIEGQTPAPAFLFLHLGKNKTKQTTKENKTKPTNPEQIIKMFQLLARSSDPR